MKKKLYLAYGSNLNIEQMSRRCPKARQIETTVLNDYKLVFRGPCGGAVANVEQHKGSCVPVLAWELTPTDEAALDRYEGYPFLYRKETVEVLLNGKVTEAMIYIMNEGRPIGIPGAYYYRVILNGYKTAGFDTNILINAFSESRQEDCDAT